MDIALILDKLVPDAEYTRADDYATLVATWTDARTIPTEQAIIDAEAGVMSDDTDRTALPSLWEVAEALLALSSDVSLDDIKNRIQAAKDAGLILP